MPARTATNDPAILARRERKRADAARFRARRKAREAGLNPLVVALVQRQPGKLYPGDADRLLATAPAERGDHLVSVEQSTYGVVRVDQHGRRLIAFGATPAEAQARADRAKHYEPKYVPLAGDASGTVRRHNRSAQRGIRPLDDRRIEGLAELRAELAAVGSDGSGLFG